MDGKRKPLLYYWAIAAVVMCVMNWVLLPFIAKSAVQSVTYDVFLDELNAKNIENVQVNENTITYTLKAEEKATSILSQSASVYTTVKMDDAALVDRLYEAGVTFNEVKPKQVDPFWSTLFMIVAFYLFWHFVMKKMMGKAGGGMPPQMSFGKSNAKIYVKAQTGKTFADVAGQDEAKEALTEIVDFLHNPDKYATIGAKLPKGALLVGPPGTGKTLLAQAVAGEADVPFFSISGSEFVELFVGMGAAKVRDLFKQANEKAPCIVFIDEIDTIGKKRDGQIGGNDEREQTLNQLLTEMDGFDGKKGVVILAATNRPESLDKALLRPGRFDRRIPVELPDLQGREAILKVHSKNVACENDIDFNSIARATAGASGAELANIVNEAALRAVRMGRNKVSQMDLEESVEVIIAGYQRKGAVISTQEKEIIAYHEVGHALVAALQSDSAPVHKITIIPRTSGALGYTMQVDDTEHNLMSKEMLFNKIATLTGGRVAEEIKFRSITTGASNDIEQATKLARGMITRYGMNEEIGMVALETVSNQYLGGDASLACSPETSTKIDKEVIRIVREAYQKAYEIIENNQDKLDSIAKYLLKQETITGEEFMMILNGPTVNFEMV